MPKRRDRSFSIRLPRPFWDRLQFVPSLDGRSPSEWARAVLLEALHRLIVERPGWAWARPAAPFWRDPGPGGDLEAGAPPLGRLQGGERVLVLAVLADSMPRDLDPEGGEGLGFLVDVVPEGSRLLRRVLMRPCDVLPWRRRPGEPMAPDCPGAVRRAEDVRARIDAEREARRLRDRVRKARKRAEAAREGPDSVDPSGDGPA